MKHLGFISCLFLFFLACAPKNYPSYDHRRGVLGACYKCANTKEPTTEEWLNGIHFFQFKLNNGHYEVDKIMSSDLITFSNEYRSNISTCIDTLISEPKPNHLKFIISRENASEYVGTHRGAKYIQREIDFRQALNISDQVITINSLFSDPIECYFLKARKHILVEKIPQSSIRQPNFSPN